MADEEHVAQLKKSVADWNAWRDRNPNIRPDVSRADLTGAKLRWTNLSRTDLIDANLSKANLSWTNLSRAKLTRAKLSEANLSGANLSRATLSWAKLSEANLSGAKLSWAYLDEANLGWADLRRAKLSEANLDEANLSGANLRWADLSKANLSWAKLSEAKLGGAKLSGANLSNADLSGAKLSRADLSGANLSKADLSGAKLSRADLSGANLHSANFIDANLREANLRSAILVKTDLTGADLTGCRIFGVSAWGLKLNRVRQLNLVITQQDEPAITVDNIEVAQFVYLMLHNQKIRDAIDTIGKKGVLLLGRFTEGRIEILERLRQKLRSLGYVPIVLNFDRPEAKNFTETVRLLANLSRFVIVDITNPRSTPLELQATVPNYMVPFVPILQEGQDPFAMFVDLNIYDWMLKPVISYSSVDRLIEVLDYKIVRPAEAKVNQLLAKRTEQLRIEKV